MYYIQGYKGLLVQLKKTFKYYEKYLFFKFSRKKFTSKQKAHYLFEQYFFIFSSRIAQQIQSFSINIFPGY
ncbi:hypothetical protein TTHERM_000355569 (macronuclear) [Tetrahymena thermophila SB210]|uniref:Uncharacterized protein n=1 Tax=Tetrahymena thermophila (strain SB210) TaxID=312017 RepID=W7XKX0_TETTS|nr:hypothetical protein TTHERM_000355569 [Tetrahymena thermophila SB210]EWS75284.1 hypothetical protein TTHERM_000355569 [Tetrahymena thermophila SB210]|eukprot:XP_012652275.1 hypothetical protein TTHERM_000355569 [Tetrahymena thermophila SB210]